MPTRGPEVYGIASGFIRRERPVFDQLVALAQDGGLTSVGRRERQEELLEPLRARYATADARIESLEIDGRAAFMERLPQELRRAAALEKPAAVLEMRSLLDGLSASETAKIVSDTVARGAQDRAFAEYAHIIARAEEWPADVVEPMLVALDGIGADERERYLADFVGTLHVRGWFQLFAATDFGLTSAIADPTALIAADYVARTVPTDVDTGTRVLSTSEFLRFLELAGVPRAIPPLPDMSAPLIGPSATLMQEPGAMIESANLGTGE